MDVWSSGIITEGALPPFEMPYVRAILDNWSVTKCPLCCVSPKASLTECRRHVCFLWGMWWVEVFRRLLGTDYFCYGFSGWRVFTTFWVNSLWDLVLVTSPLFVFCRMKFCHKKNILTLLNICWRVKEKKKKPEYNPCCHFGILPEVFITKPSSYHHNYSVDTVSYPNFFHWIF